MYKKIDISSDFITKASSQVIWTFFIAINFTTLFRLTMMENPGSYNADQIFLLSFANYLLSYIITYVITIFSKNRPRLRMIIPALAIISTFFTSLFIMRGFPIEIKIGGVFYFLILWKQGGDFAVDDCDLDTFKRNFWLSAICVFGWIIFLLLVMGVMKDYSYKWVFMRYAPIYLIVSIVTLVRMTYIRAYDNKYKNTINAKNNIFKINIASIVIVSVTLVLILTNYFGTGVGGVEFIYIALSKVLDIIILILGVIVTGIDWILQKTIGTSLVAILMAFLEALLMMINGLKADQVTGDKTAVTNSAVEKLANSSRRIILIAIFALIVFLIIRRLRHLFLTKRDDVQLDGEEKDFVLNKGDIKRSFANSFNRVKNKVTGVFKKEKPSDIHLIRQVYIKAVNKAQNQGLIYEKHETPNEYLESKVDEYYKSIGFGKLTHYYNQVKYGNKELAKEEIKELMSIRDKINNIE